MRVDLVIEEGKEVFYDFNNETNKNLKITASKQLYDAWDEEKGPEKGDFELTATGLTELYTKLYDVLNSSSQLDSPEFYIDDVLFAKTIGGFHLEVNENFPINLIEKYGSTKNIELKFTDTIRVPYGDDRKVDGIAVEILGSIKGYNSSSSSNYIKNENHTKEFKTEELAKKAVDYYLTKDGDAYIPFVDKVNANLNGEDLGLFVLGKKIEKDAPKQEEELKQEPRRNKRKI